MGEAMKEFNEKRVYMTMEISITCKEEIERIIKNKEISFNEFINQAIKNNFKENLNWHKEIKISEKTIKCEIRRRKGAADFIGYACCVHVDKSLGK